MPGPGRDGMLRSLYTLHRSLANRPLGHSPSNGTRSLDPTSRGMVVSPCSFSSRRRFAGAAEAVRLGHSVSSLPTLIRQDVKTRSRGIPRTSHTGRVGRHPLLRTAGAGARGGRVLAEPHFWYIDPDDIISSPLEPASPSATPARSADALTRGCKPSLPLLPSRTCTSPRIHPRIGRC